MSIFAFYVANQLLTEAGWPRKLGILKGQGYDASMVDACFAQSINWGAALGAGRPPRALQMIAEMFRDRDWEGDDAPNVKMFVERTRETWEKAASPGEVAPPPGFAKNMATLSVEQWLRRETATAMEPRLFEALLWGMEYPDRFEAWYSSTVADHESRLPEMRDAGLEVDEFRTLPQFFEDSAEILRDYERDVGPLPSIPPRLLADADALGWRV